MEATVDHSSEDSDFKSKLVSPAAKKILHSRIEETPAGKLQKLLNKTYVRNTNPDSRLVKDLNKHIILQYNIIVNLRQKISLIRDISNDTN